MDLGSPSEHLCYVRCAYCTTVLAVGVPCKRMTDTVTVKCGHCNSLSFLNPKPPFQTLCSDHHQTLLQRPCNFLWKGQHSLASSSSAVAEDMNPKAVPFVVKPPEKKHRLPSAYNRFMRIKHIHMIQGNEFIDFPVEDDEVYEMVLSHVIGQILILYVEVDEIGAPSNVVEIITPQVHETFILEEKIKGVPMIPPVKPLYANERQRSHWQEEPRPSARPSLIVDDGYETMSSGSNESGDIDDDDNVLYGADEVNIDMNTEINSVIQRYCYVNVGIAEGMAANNDFVKTYLSTYEWERMEEIQRIKAAHPDIPHREAFSTAAKNWAKCDPRALFYSATGTSGAKRATTAIQQEKRSGVPVESFDVSKHGQLHRME
ncbi:hypothetical protein M5K25_014566 [Dendrobium thyrsiflorum]|uniref:Uncharacterized protein n=1 Tax=Dendrobium thyrsiflorum TaxID=117978 RepID=A0ABD0UNU5_DENTH